MNHWLADFLDMGVSPSHRDISPPLTAVSRRRSGDDQLGGISTTEFVQLLGPNERQHVNREPGTHVRTSGGCHGEPTNVFVSKKTR